LYRLFIQKLYHNSVGVPVIMTHHVVGTLWWQLFWFSHWCTFWCIPYTRMVFCHRV